MPRGASHFCFTRITIDKDADAGYIYLKDIAPGESTKTIKASEDVILDYDKEGNLLGIELLFVSKNLPRDFLSTVSVENLC